MIRIATVFSGIGAPEQALKQLGVNHQIVFACDNGERYLSQTVEEIEQLIKDTPILFKSKSTATHRDCCA